MGGGGGGGERGAQTYVGHLIFDFFEEFFIKIPTLAGPAQQVFEWGWEGLKGKQDELTRGRSGVCSPGKF